MSTKSTERGCRIMKNKYESHHTDLVNENGAH